VTYFIKALATLTIMSTFIYLILVIITVGVQDDPRVISEYEYMEASTLCMGSGGVLLLRIYLSDGSFTKLVDCKDGEEFSLNNVQEK
jgi:hypothetical protein